MSAGRDADDLTNYVSTPETTEQAEPDAPEIDLDERAEGRIHNTQVGNCTACGKRLAGGGATLAIATAIDAGAAPGQALLVPMLIHHLCIDDAHRHGLLDGFPDLTDEEAEAARAARAGALKLAQQPIVEAEARAAAAEQRAAAAERRLAATAVAPKRRRTIAP